jgi:hypothetical protein
MSLTVRPTFPAFIGIPGLQITIAISLLWVSSTLVVGGAFYHIISAAVKLSVPLCRTNLRISFTTPLFRRCELLSTTRYLSSKSHFVRRLSFPLPNPSFTFPNLSLRMSYLLLHRLLPLSDCRQSESHPWYHPHSGASPHGRGASDPALPPLYRGSERSSGGAGEPVGGSRRQGLSAGYRQRCDTSRDTTEEVVAQGPAHVDTSLPGTTMIVSLVTFC